MQIYVSPTLSMKHTVFETDVKLSLNMFSRQGTITRVKRGSTGSVYGDRNAV